MARIIFISPYMKGGRDSARLAHRTRYFATREGVQLLKDDNAHLPKRGLYTMGQSYRGNIEGSDPKHSFHYLGGDDTLYVFEAPIDLLSYISLFTEGWQEHNYVACCGTSSIPVLEMLRQLPQLRQVYLCLDNDAAGHAASERMGKLLEERGISAERLVPQQKDWNDDLKAEQENKMERSELCQTFC